MKHLLFSSILLLTTTVNSSAQAPSCDRMFITFEYSKYGRSENRTDIVARNNYGLKHYLMETSVFPFVWTNNDPYNHNRFNLSLLILTDPLIKLPILILNGKEKSLFFLLSFPNAKHSYFPFQDFCKEGMLGTIQPSVFLKQNTDLFIFRNKKWFNYSPGLGLSCYLGWPYLELGYNRNFRCDFQKVYKRDYVYFTIGLLSRDG